MSTTSAENNNENDNNTTVAPEAREEANIGVAPQGEVAAPKEGKGRKGGKSGSGGGKKGKRGGTKKKGSGSGSSNSSKTSAKAKPSKSIRTVRDKIKCSFCANLMSQSKNINYVEIPGKKVAKSGKTGEPMYKSLKGDSDAVLGVLCDDCLKLKESGVASVKLKTAVIERRDGTVMNIPLRDVPNA